MSSKIKDYRGLKKKKAIISPFIFGKNYAFLLLSGLPGYLLNACHHVIACHQNLGTARASKKIGHHFPGVVFFFVWGPRVYWAWRTAANFAWRVQLEDIR